MTNKAISGRKAAVYISTSTPALFGPELGTYDAARDTISLSTQFWHDSDQYPITILANGILTGGIISASTTAGEVNVTALTAYQNGTSVSVAAGSVSSLTKATGTGNQIVYAIIVTTAGALSKVNGVSGVASTTLGASGGPPAVGLGSLIVGYVARPASGTSTVVSSEISLSLYGGQERAHNPMPYEIHPITGKLEFVSGLAAQHTGGTAKRIYVKGYQQNATMKKVAQLIDWKLGVTRNREDTTKQNDGATSSDPGRKSYTFSANQFVADNPDLIFSHVNNQGHDFIVKMFTNQFDTTKYYAAQIGFDMDAEFPNNDKIKHSVTGQVSGHVEEFTS